MGGVGRWVKPAADAFLNAVSGRRPWRGDRGRETGRPLLEPDDFVTAMGAAQPDKYARELLAVGCQIGLIPRTPLKVHCDGLSSSDAVKIAYVTYSILLVWRLRPVIVSDDPIPLETLLLYIGACHIINSMGALSDPEINSLLPAIIWVVDRCKGSWAGQRVMTWVNEVTYVHVKKMASQDVNVRKIYLVLDQELVVYRNRRIDLATFLHGV